MLLDDSNASLLLKVGSVMVLDKIFVVHRMEGNEMMGVCKM